MKTRVILVRHGQSTYNQMRRIQGHCDDSSLTALGEDQAQQVGRALGGVEFDAIWCSPLKRAHRTAQLIAEVLHQRGGIALTPHPSDDLKEVSLPLWEGMSFQAAEDTYPNEYRAWRTDPANFSMTLESGPFFPIRDVYEQAQRFWNALLPAHPGKTLLVVAHSAINRALISTALGIGPERFNNLYQANCAISVLNFPAGGAAQLESMNLTSHMGQTLPPMRTGHRGPRLLLVRHGETNWNRDKRFQGQIDVPLNDTGRDQGRQAAEFLKTVPMDAAYTSSMARPRETAELILQHHPGLELKQTDGLREISHGEWEGKLEAEIEAGYPGMLQQWQELPETVQMPGGENLDQVWERTIASWNDIVAAHSGSDTVPTVLVTAHDAVNKAILCYVTGCGPDAFWRFKQGNGAVSVIDYPNGIDSEPVLSAANLTPHLSGSIFDRTAAGAL